MDSVVLRENCYFLHLDIEKSIMLNLGWIVLSPVQTNQLNLRSLVKEWSHGHHLSTLEEEHWQGLSGGLRLLVQLVVSEQLERKQQQKHVLNLFIHNGSHVGAMHLYRRVYLCFNVAFSIFCNLLQCYKK